MKGRYFFTSESVTEGHPDKVADQISDAVLDAVLEKDPRARVDCETMLMQGAVIVTGQITTSASYDVDSIARGVLRDIGFGDPEAGIDPETCKIIVSITEQSPEIAAGVNRPAEEQGAGDQGMMYGYATSETPSFMPLPIVLAHVLAKQLADARKQGVLPYLRPDGKSQITIEYQDSRPRRADAIVIAAQHDESVSEDQVRKDVIKHVISEAVPEEFVDGKTKIIVNSAGKFVIGGTLADTGVTGRKIVVDTYGGMGSHGGGCFSGKDPSKVDRSGSYMARYIAKNIVASGLAEKCGVQVAYAIGIAEPVSVMTEAFDSGKIPDEQLTDIVGKVFDLRPGMIIRHLDLLRPIYRKTACYGHFGRSDPDFTWEKTDKAGEIRRLAPI